MDDPDRRDAGAPLPDDSAVLVFRAPATPEGETVRSLLESEGITVLVKGEAEGPYRFGPMEIWVPKSLEERARRTIEEARSSELAPEDAQTEDVSGVDPSFGLIGEGAGDPTSGVVPPAPEDPNPNT